MQGDNMNWKEPFRGRMKDGIVQGRYQLAEDRYIDLDFYVCEETVQRIYGFFTSQHVDFQMEKIIIRHRKGFLHFYYPVRSSFWLTQPYYLGKHWDTGDWNVQMERIILQLRTLSGWRRPIWC
jgi:hypothetical protein